MWISGNTTYYLYLPQISALEEALEKGLEKGSSDQKLQ